MYELLSMILSQITTHPDEVQISQGTEEGREVFTIQVHPEDMGRVIGKSGKVIQAIRSLAHVVAIRQNTRYRINVAESADGQAPTAEAEAPMAEPQEAEDQSILEETTTMPDANEAQEVVDQAVEETSAADLISGAIDLSDMEEEA